MEHTKGKERTHFGIIQMKAEHYWKQPPVVGKRAANFSEEDLTGDADGICDLSQTQHWETFLWLSLLGDYHRTRNGTCLLVIICFLGLFCLRLKTENRPLQLGKQFGVFMVSENIPENVSHKSFWAPGGGGI